jgi:hypothetical protein
MIKFQNGYGTGVLELSSRGRVARASIARRRE